MKVTVDESMCTGCGACAEACPEVFEMGADNLSKVKVAEVPEALKSKASDAAQVCPVTCIEVKE
jgi:ferredoxin